MIKKNNSNSSSNLSFLLKMALRDGKASGKKLVLFMASIVLGIAAVVSIQSFGTSLEENIGNQSKALMGADFIIDSNAKPNKEVQDIMDSLGGPQAKGIGFASMALFPKNEATKLVQVRGLQKGFPFYGEIETEPASAAEAFNNKNVALVDATVMLQLNIELGDTVKIGKLKLPIAGAVISIPGNSAFFSAVAPPVIIPYHLVPQTKLIQTGSRIDYEYYFEAPDTNMAQLEEKLGDRLDALNADLDTHASTSQRMGRRYENFGKFLNLVAFIALLLGCIGIASAINVYIKDKLNDIAILKCIGATRKQTFLIYLIQVAVIGLIAGIIGTILGLLLQQLFPLLLEGLLPIDVPVSYSLQVIFMGLLLGVVMSILFALYPLMGTLYVSPLQALRVVNKSSARTKKAAFWVLFSIILFIFIFSFWLLKDWLYSLAFVGGTIVTFAILVFIAQSFMNFIRKYFPNSWGFAARQSLSNLFRPQNQTLTLVLAIGVGTFLISTLYFSKDILLAQTSFEENAERPNLILMDVQSEQREAVAQTIQQNKLPLIDDIPIVTMRVAELKGKPVYEIRNDSNSKVDHWVLDHEFRITYRDSLINSETLEEGEWIGNAGNAEVIPISVSAGFAKDAKVAMGDSIVFNIQGMLQETVVKSIRKVDWSQLQPNFTVLFPKGVLEKAPQFRVLTTFVPEERASARLQQQLVKKFPNVFIIDLRQMINVVQNMLTKISWIINFMAFFSIFTGIVVLIGAVRTSKYQRIKESVLLRTIGARGKIILKIAAFEYLYLGILGSLAGILLSLISSLLIAWFAFETTFTPSLFPFLVLFPGITLIVLAIGLGNSLSVIKHSPLEVLRKERA